LTAAAPATLADPNRVVELRDLSVNFGHGERIVRAVRSVDLHLDRGETLAVVGESGSGKSVTALALMRLVEFGGGRIDRGQMLFRRGDATVTDLRMATEDQMRAIRGGDIGMIFQEPMTSLNPVFTVGSQISESILLHRHCSRAEADAAARRMLDQVRIPDSAAVMRRYPHQLSGGMRQRVMIAMALSCRPALLIADEPTTALDVTIQAQILQLMRELQRELGMAVIFITHDMGVVAEIADRVMVMRHGEVVERDDVHRLFGAPSHPYTRMLMATVPRLGSMNGTDVPTPFELGEDAVALGLVEDRSAVRSEGTSPAPTRSAGQGAVADQGAGGGPDIGPGGTASPIAGRRAGERLILRVRDLVTRFDVRSGIFSRVTRRIHAVEHVSFDLYQGETLSLVGESGCGKTTTGRSLVRLAPVQSGLIEFEGQTLRVGDRRALRQLRRQMQFVFQDPFASLNPRMRVGDCIKEPMLIQGLADGVAADRKVSQLMERVGLDPATASRWPHEFSGGQRQRICIARALSVDPKVVIADEAVSALDVSIRAQIVNLLIDLQHQLGVSYLFISHDMAVVERISHRVAVMYLGQIVEIGPRRAIFENPQHPYTRKLMAAVPMPDPARRRQYSLEASEIPSPARALGDHPVVKPLVEVGPGHFVARHPVGHHL
jgi:peptide/nickel transport system ATP-binding protein/glutathione transport system ATP-binding protein